MQTLTAEDGKAQGFPKIDFNPDPKALLPVLQPWMCDGVMGPALKHPLVMQYPLYSASMANQMYEQKFKRVRALQGRRQFDSAIGYYERYSRLSTVYEWFRDGRLSVTMLRKLLRFAWPDTEDPPYDEALEMFLTAGYTSDTKKKLKGMLTLYRGDSRKRHNMEWSLQRSTGEWFARRYSCKTPWLAITQIDAKHALAYFTCRGEEEVIVFPKAIGKVTYERLQP